MDINSIDANARTGAEKWGESKGIDGSPEITLNAGIVTNEELDIYRKQLGNPLNKKGDKADTIAIGKTDIKGLENIKFYGASPTIRRTAGLPSLDEQYPNRAIKAPWDAKKRGYGQFTRHAEEGVIAEFEVAINNMGIKNNEVKGTLYIHQSNQDGVCPMCTKGLFDNTEPKGIFKQLTERYPNLKIVVTSDTRNGTASGRSSLTFNVLNGKVTNWTKK